MQSYSFLRKGWWLCRVILTISRSACDISHPCFLQQDQNKNQLDFNSFNANATACKVTFVYQCKANVEVKIKRMLESWGIFLCRKDFIRMHCTCTTISANLKKEWTVNKKGKAKNNPYPFLLFARSIAYCLQCMHSAAYTVAVCKEWSQEPR